MVAVPETLQSKIEALAKGMIRERSSLIERVILRQVDEQIAELEARQAERKPKRPSAPRRRPRAD
jgi:hypothetical protein